MKKKKIAHLSDYDFLGGSAFYSYRTHKNILKHTNHLSKMFVLFKNTKDKSIFFSDEIHSTGAGNRLLAFNVMEKINKFRANKLSTIKRPKSKPLNKNRKTLNKCFFAS